MLDSLAFAYVWNNQALDNLTFQEIKQKLFDNVNQELIMSINTSTKLQSYCLFKEDTRPNYMSMLSNPININLL